MGDSLHRVNIKIPEMKRSLTARDVPSKGHSKSRPFKEIVNNPVEIVYDNSTMTCHRVPYVSTRRREVSSESVMHPSNDQQRERVNRRPGVPTVSVANSSQRERSASHDTSMHTSAPSRGTRRRSVPQETSTETLASLGTSRRSFGQETATETSAPSRGTRRRSVPQETSTETLVSHDTSRRSVPQETSTETLVSHDTSRRSVHEETSTETLVSHDTSRRSVHEETSTETLTPSHGTRRRSVSRDVSTQTAVLSLESFSDCSSNYFLSQKQRPESQDKKKPRSTLLSCVTELLKSRPSHLHRRHKHKWSVASRGVVNRSISRPAQVKQVEHNCRSIIVICLIMFGIIYLCSTYGKQTYHRVLKWYYPEQSVFEMICCWPMRFVSAFRLFPYRK